MVAFDKIYCVFCGRPFEWLLRESFANPEDWRVKIWDHCCGSTTEPEQPGHDLAWQQLRELEKKLPISSVALSALRPKRNSPENQVCLVSEEPKENPQAVWTFPGGTLLPHEDPFLGLARELNEELPRTSCVVDTFIVPQTKFPWREVAGISPRGGQPIFIRLFSGSITGDLKPGKEIKQAGWFTFEEIFRMKLAMVTRLSLDRRLFLSR